MNRVPCTDEELVLSVDGLERKALLRSPECVSPGGCLLIDLAWDRTTTLDLHPYSLVADIFLAAGHRVASLDMPKHGELADAGDGGEGLAGMANAMARGEDIFAEFRATGRAFIDACVARGIVQPGRVVVTGTSRGGHASLHLMAGDPRVLGCAAMFPVTYLPALDEFAPLVDIPRVQAANAEALLPQLADRPVFLCIGEGDPRVSAAHCFNLYARLNAAARHTKPVLYILPGETHGAAFLEPGYQSAAAYLLGLCADEIK